MSPAAASAATQQAAPAPVAAAAPLAQSAEQWASPNGNSMNQDYSSQTQINASNVGELAVNWLFPLPIQPNALITLPGYGVDSSLLIINGTVFATTQFGQIFAFAADSGDVLWTYVLPLTVNSTLGEGAGPILLHLHDGEIQYTTATFGSSGITGPSYWVSAPDHNVYVLDALTGTLEENFSAYGGCQAGSTTVPSSSGVTCGVTAVKGNNPASMYAPLASNILVDESKGIAITSMVSSSTNDAARCFYRGWDMDVNPPLLKWETYCSPPQPGSNVPVNPNWDIQQVANMTGAEIFYPGPTYDNGGTIPGTAVVNLKTLSPSQLNSTLYNDWGYVQSGHCASEDGGASPGATGAGWGGAWLLGQGASAGIAYVNTGNKGPYNGDCNPGPDLWASSALALNESNGDWIWGFQTSAHDEWDWDCAWWQAMGNETINGVNTQVVFKTCKNGYLYELNALTGNLIWAYTPQQSVMARCPYCYILNPLNQTEMTEPFFNPSLQTTLMYPSELAGFENEPSYDPALNMVFTASQNAPQDVAYQPFNSTNYGQNMGQTVVATAATALTNDNATVEGINAANGQQVWTHFIAGEGYRGGITSSAGVVFLTLSSGHVLMLDAQTGSLLKDLYLGGPLNILPSIGATENGVEEVIFPVTAGLVTWGTGVPGDIIALSLGGSAGLSTTSGSASITTTTTTTSVVTVTSGSTVSATLVYGIGAIAVVFIIAAGYLATRRRKPAPKVNPAG